MQNTGLVKLFVDSAHKVYSKKIKKSMETHDVYWQKIINNADLRAAYP